MTDDYRAGLQTLYDGEVMGERLPLALHAAARSPREADQFAAILQLETETKARLRPLLLKHGMSPAETADLGGIPARLANYASQEWRDYSAATAARLAGVLRDYEAIAALGPPEDQPILQAVEKAGGVLLLDWVKGQNRGRNRSVAGGNPRPAVLPARRLDMRLATRAFRRQPRGERHDLAASRHQFGLWKSEGDTHVALGAGAEGVARQHGHAFLLEQAAGEGQGRQAGGPHVQQGEHAPFRGCQPAAGRARQQSRER